MPKDDKNNNDLPYSGKSVGNYDDLGELDPEVFKKEDGIDPHEAGKVPKSFWQKTVEKGKQTIAGETTVGKVGAVVKNIAKNFVPYGDKIDAVTDAVGDNFKTKDNNDMSWFANRIKEKSTWAGIVTVLTAIGVSISPDQKEALIAAGTAVVGAILAFTKESKSNDAK